MGKKREKMSLKDAHRVADKLLTATQDELRFPQEEARTLGGFLKDLLNQVGAQDKCTAKEGA